MQIQTHSPEETEDVGRKLAAQLQPGDVLAYYGDLGAGKTAFTRGLAPAISCSSSAGRIISRGAASAPWSGAKESYFEPKFKLLFENQQATLEQLAPKSRLEELEDEVAVLRAAVRQHSTEIAKLKQA